MALPKVERIEIHYLDLWFANLVDNMNYNLDKIEGEVPTLDMVLTNLDPAPVQYLRDSFDKLVDNINKGFEQIDDRLRKIESQIGQLSQGGR